MHHVQTENRRAIRNDSVPRVSGLVGIDDKEHGITDRDLVSLTEFSVFYGDIVDECSIEALQISNEQFAIFANDDAMPPRHRTTIDTDRVGWITPNGNLRAVQVHGISIQGTG